MMRKKYLVILILFVLILPRPGAEADTVDHEADRVGCGHCKDNGSGVAPLLNRADLLYAQFKPKAAIAELLKALELDSRNHEAFAKLSRAYIDVGDMIPESASDWQDKRMKEYVVAEEYARKAVEADPNSTWGHFYVAASLGKIAVLSPVSKQVELAEQIHQAVEKSIALDPRNGFAYHVYGVWHRKVAEIGQMKRAFATVVLWRSIPQGTMEKSVDYLKRAIALNPTVIASRLELAKTYLATEQWSLARNHLKSIGELPIQFSDDPIHKQKASQMLREIKDK
jgi:tetratricopeptide (TPR) repeat protein